MINMEKPIVVNCPKCGKQNLIAPERMKIAKENPVKCWVCDYKFTYEELLKIIKGGARIRTGE